MMNKTSRLAFALVSVLALAAVAPLQAQPCRFLSCGGPMMVDLKVNRSAVVGNVTVSSDSVAIYVNYTAAAGYLLTDLNLSVTSSFNAIPRSSSGAPRVSSFPYAATFKPGVSSYFFTIPVAGFPAGTQLYIAAEAEVIRTTSANRNGGGYDDDCDDRSHSIVGETGSGERAYAEESADKHGSGGYDDDCDDRGHSIVGKTGSSGGYGDHCGCSGSNSLVAWGNGTRFSGSQDAMYFKYTVPTCGGE